MATTRPGAGTDHTRERVPVLAPGPGSRRGTSASSASPTSARRRGPPRARARARTGGASCEQRPRRADEDPEHLTVVDHPLVQHKLTIMRERETSTAGFRRLLREISLLLAYEVTRDLADHETIETPMTEMEAPVLEGKKLVLISILRAGNGLLDGMLDWCRRRGRLHRALPRRDDAAAGRVLLQGAGRPRRPADDRVDPMLATGNSRSPRSTLPRSAGATNIRFLCLLAAPEGIERLQGRRIRTCRSSPPRSTAS